MKLLAEQVLDMVALRELLAKKVALTSSVGPATLRVSVERKDHK